MIIPLTRRSVLLMSNSIMQTQQTQQTRQMFITLSKTRWTYLLCLKRLVASHVCRVCRVHVIEFELQSAY